MKPHPRIRKTIKWGGAAVTVVFTAAWAVSIWTNSGLTGSTGGVVLYRGRIQVSHHAPDDWPTHAFFDPSMGWGLAGSHYWFGLEDDQRGWRIDIPVWAPLALTLAATAAAWRLDALARRRARLNLCPKCNYDRTGLVGGAGAVCPECGSLPA